MLCAVSCVTALRLQVEVRRKAEMRLRYESKENADEITDKASEFFGKPAEFVSQDRNTPRPSTLLPSSGCLPHESAHTPSAWPACRRSARRSAWCHVRFALAGAHVLFTCTDEQPRRRRCTATTITPASNAKSHISAGSAIAGLRPAQLTGDYHLNRMIVLAPALSFGSLTVTLRCACSFDPTELVCPACSAGGSAEVRWCLS